MQTNSAAAPWTIVEATQRRFARVTVFRTLIAAVRGSLASPLRTRQDGRGAGGEGRRCPSSPRPPAGEAA